MMNTIKYDDKVCVQIHIHKHKTEDPSASVNPCVFCDMPCGWLKPHDHH